MTPLDTVVLSAEGKKGLKMRLVYSQGKAYQEVLWVVSVEETLDHFPNVSIYPHEDLRSFQDPGSLESIKSMRLFMANL